MENLNEIDDKLFEGVTLNMDKNNPFAESEDTGSIYEEQPDSGTGTPEIGEGSESVAGNVQTINASTVIQGRFLVELIDKFAPPLMVVSCKYFGVKATKKQFAFTKPEKEDMLIPVTDAYLQSVDVKLTPLQALLFAFGSVYGGKLIEVVGKESAVVIDDNDDPNKHNTPATKRTYKKRTPKL